MHATVRILRLGLGVRVVSSAWAQVTQRVSVGAEQCMQ
jgi:hypothetical protein